MSYRIQKCNHCAQQYIAGENSTDYRCNPCRRKGHNIDYNKCSICSGFETEGKDPMANLDTIINTMKRREG